MIRLKAHLQSYKTKSGQHNILIRIYRNGERCYARTGIFVKKSEYDSKKGRVIRHPLSSDYNHYLQAIQNKVIQAEQEAVLQDRYFSLEEAKDIIEGRKTSQNSKLIDYIDQFVEASYSPEQYQTIYNFKVLKDLIIGFAGPDVSIYQVNNTWGNSFKKYLASHYKKPSSANKYLNLLRQIFNYAIDDTHNHISTNPMRSVKKLNDDQDIEKRKALTDEELLRIERTPLPKRLNLYRDIFLTAFYLGGIRISDVLTLRAGAFVTNRYKAQKTGKLSAIVKHEKLMNILNPYLEGKTAENLVFPILNPRLLDAPSHVCMYEVRKRNTTVNRNLALITEICSIPIKVTTKTARQTFAQRVAELEDKKLASMALNHSDSKITERYLDHFNALEYAINKLFVS